MARRWARLRHTANAYTRHTRHTRPRLVLPCRLCHPIDPIQSNSIQSPCSLQPPHPPAPPQAPDAVAIMAAPTTSTSRATTTPQNHLHKPTHNHLPPSPPPSPQTTIPRRRKKRVDSFAQLAAATPLPSPLSSPGLQAESEAGSESLLTRVSPCQSVFTVHDPSNAPLDPPHSPLLHFIPTLALPRKPS
jgi:hypothetical protein